MIKKFSWICVVLIIGSSAWGQQAQKQPPAQELADVMLLAQLLGSSNTPEAVVQSALQNSPEIRKAELAVESAQADLALVRARITRDVIAIHTKITSLHNDKKRVERLVDSGHSTTFDLDQVLMSLAELETELKYLTGSRASDGKESSPIRGFVDVFVEKPIAVKRPAIAKGNHIADILQNPVGLTFENISWPDMMDYVSDTYELNVNIDATLMEAVVPRVNLKNVTLYNAFLALAEQNEDICFVVRDYGIFVTTRDHAAKIPGPTIPTNIPFYE